jgi:hypothetical protein
MELRQRLERENARLYRREEIFEAIPHPKDPRYLLMKVSARFVDI